MTIRKALKTLIKKTKNNNYFALKFLEIKFHWKIRSKMRLPQSRKTKEETATIVLTVLSNNVSCKNNES